MQDLFGIIHWQIRNVTPVEASAKPVFPEWDELENSVKQCQSCTLHQSRTQTVFGVGNQNANVMLIGEAPGFHEDQQGEPFVGRAGQLLTAMIKTIGFDRSDVYIANILKCRPPNNRDPLPEEVASCTPHLTKQIALIQPRLIVAIGRIASHYLLNTKSSLESLRNKVHTYGEPCTPLIVTYHPAYLLRNPADKRKAFSDLLFIQRTLRENTHGRLSNPSIEGISSSSS